MSNRIDAALFGALSDPSVPTHLAAAHPLNPMRKNAALNAMKHLPASEREAAIAGSKSLTQLEKAALRTASGSLPIRGSAER